jgi:hypothetical protein
MTYEQILINGISERDKRIAELEEIIRGRDELINNAVSSRIAELENQWISVFDMLPDTGRVLATGNGYDSEIVVFLKFVGGGGKFRANGLDCTESVTHWMPLPEPPKEQGE